MKHPRCQYDEPHGAHNFVMWVGDRAPASLAAWLAEPADAASQLESVFCPGEPEQAPCSCPWRDATRPQPHYPWCPNYVSGITGITESGPTP